MPTVSLVITTYNWKEALAVCLASVLRQRQLPDEVIIADDGSRPDIGEFVRGLAGGFPVPLLHAWQEDRGFRAARVRNLGLAASRGEYVVFLDGDMVLHPEFIADHLALIRPGRYLQGGRLNASVEVSARLLAGELPEFSPRMPFARSGHGELKPKHATRRLWLAWLKSIGRHRGASMSCNLGAWRSDLERINGFDNAYEGWGREDDDLALRLSHAGVRRSTLRYAGLAVHLWHRTRWPEGLPPDQVLPNDALLEAARQGGRIRAVHGLAEIASGRALAA